MVIDHGRVIAHGTSAQLKAQVGGERVEVVVAGAGDVDTARAVLAQLAEGGVVEVEEHTRRLTAPVTGGAAALTEALRRLDAAEVVLHDVALRRPTLDDVFLTLTGHHAEDAAAAAAATEQAQPAELTEVAP